MFRKIVLAITGGMVLIGACIVANAETTTFTVDPKYSDRYLAGYPHTGFQSSEVQLLPGDHLIIVSTGLSCAVPGGCNGPNGNGAPPPPSMASSFLAPYLSATALVGKIGTNAPFFVGESLDVFVTQAGTLYLGFNDSRCDDNSGAFYSQITVVRPPVNNPPVAEAGADQTVTEGSLVTLDGSAAIDPDGDALTFQWMQVSGTPVALNTSDSVRPTFTAPLVTRGGETLTFQLVVNDGNLVSKPDFVNINVKNLNHLPETEAGPIMTVGERSQVTLDGSATFDPDGDVLTYQWTQIAGSPVELSGATTTKPVFVAPAVGVEGAILTFQLSASDGIEAVSDTVDVVVENINHAPLADAGDLLMRNEGNTVVLNGSKSSDQDGDLITYSWRQLEGIPVQISNSYAQSPSFTAPFVGLDGALLKFELVVNDGLVESNPAHVLVKVLDVNAPPSCDTAKADPSVLWPPNHKLAPVGITGLQDPENNEVNIELLNITQDEPTNGLGDGDTSLDAYKQENGLLLRAERAGNGNGRTYGITFKATDSFGESCTGAVTVTVPHDRHGISIDDGQLYDSLLP